MKKIYLAPEFQEIELEIEAPILVESGGGISDNGEANTSETESTDPSSDFGWGNQ